MNQQDVMRTSDFHHKMGPPFFPMPFDPRINPWMNFGPVSPEMVPYVHQYFVPYAHAPPVPAETMANASQFLMMHQLHPPPIQHMPHYGGAPVTGKPGQVPPMDRPRRNKPARGKGGHQQPNYRMMAPPAPAPDASVHQRRSRAIPIIDPDTQEELLVKINSDSPARLSASNLAPTETNHSIILRKETPGNSPPPAQVHNMDRSPAGQPSSVPPPSIPAAVGQITTANGTPSGTNGDAPEKSITKSTLSIYAEPFVSRNRPRPHAEEVHQPAEVVLHSSSQGEQEEHQPTEQAATIPHKEPELAEAPTATTGTPTVSANVDPPSIEIDPQLTQKQPFFPPPIRMNGEDPDMRDAFSDISSAESTLSSIAEACGTSGDSSNQDVPQAAAVAEVSSPATVAPEQLPISPEKPVPLEMPEPVQTERLEVVVEEQQPVDTKAKATSLEKPSVVNDQPEEAAVVGRKKNSRRKKKKHRMKRVETEPAGGEAPVTATVLLEQQTKFSNDGISDYNAVPSSKKTNDEEQVNSGQPTPPKQLEIGDNPNITVVISTPAVAVESSPKESAQVALEQQTKEPIPEPAPLETVRQSPTALNEKPRSLIEYNPDQWSPDNLSGKKKYSYNQLLLLKHSVHSLKKPFNLPKSVRIVLDRSGHCQEHIMRSGNHFGKSYPTEMSLLPNFMRQGERGRGGFEPSQQGPRQTDSRTIVFRLQLNEDELKKCENAWRPKQLQRNVAMDEKERNTQDLFKRFRSILNKLTPENFMKLVEQVRTFVIDNDERLNGCIDLVFEKAIAEPTFSETYAKMCKEIGTVACVVTSPDQKPISFKHRLVTRCQAEFEQRRNDQTSASRDVRIKLEANRNLDKEQFEDLKAQLEEEEQKVRRRAVGTIRFIGELYKQGQLTSNIMHGCIKLLLAEDSRDYDEETLECLCKLLTTIGSKIENENRQDLRPYFQKMDRIVQQKDQYRISSRIRFMIQDVIDLRLNGWKPRRQELKPKTMDEIQDEAQKEQNRKTTTSYPPFRGGGGGCVGPRGCSGLQGDSRKAVSTNSSGPYDQGRRRSPESVVSNTRPSIDPKRFNIPSNLDGTRLGSAANYQDWRNNSNMFALLNKEDSATEGDGYRNQRDRYCNENIVYRDSYHKRPMMEPDRYNRYGSSGRQNDDPRVIRPLWEPSPVRMTPTNKQQQPTNHGRSSEQRYIPPSLGSLPARTLGPTCMPSFAMPKSVADRQNFPAPDREASTKIQKIANSVNIEMEQSDIEASAMMLTDLNIPAEYCHAAISQLLMDNIERDVKSREMVVQVVATMFEKNLIAKTDYLHALEELFKVADDLIIDLPQLFRYVATFYVTLLNKRFINLVDVRNAAKEILPQYGASMLKELLINYEAVYGKNATVMLWNESSLGLNDFIKLDSADKAEKYLTDANLGYLFDSKR